MFSIVVTLSATIFYLLAAFVLARRLLGRSMDATGRMQGLLLGLAGAALHAILLKAVIITDAGLNLSFTNTGSLATWFIAVLLLLASFKKPIENLAILVLPLSAASLLVQVLLPTTHFTTGANAHGLGVHILLSVLAYAMLGMAAVQALLLNYQERHLHSRHPGGIIRALPPLDTMETLLVQMITIGFALHTLSLASGFVYLENMFAQHLAHKTILSIVAWTVFAILLFGRWRYGWRGRTATRWTLSGFVTLVIAYFGSKYVLEVILSR